MSVVKPETTRFFHTKPLLAVFFQMYVHPTNNEVFVNLLHYDNLIIVTRVKTLLSPKAAFFPRPSDASVVAQRCCTIIACGVPVTTSMTASTEEFVIIDAAAAAIAG